MDRRRSFASSSNRSSMRHLADALIDIQNPAAGLSFAGIKKRGRVKRRAFEMQN